MELLCRFGVLALLLCLAHAGRDATSSRSAEDYWRSIWPDASMPKSLEYLLGSGRESDAENQDTQYPITCFFEKDLHAGKQIKMIFNSPYANEEQNNNINAMEKEAEKIDEDPEKLASTQPYGVGSWKRNTESEALEKLVSIQPYSVFAWKIKTVNEDSEKSASTHPNGVGSWKRNTVSEALEKLVSIQPYSVFAWKTNKVSEDSEKSASTKPYGVGLGKRKTTMVNDPENLGLEALCNAKERFVGEDSKFCAKSVESLLDFVTSKLGKDIEALTTSFVPHQTEYKILDGIKRVSSEGMRCHKLNFKKPVFYCHQVNATITYTVPMEAADGTKTTMVVLCHRDTRGLDPHKLFHQLKVKPGTVPVCHFLGSKGISWVPRNNELRPAY